MFILQHKSVGVTANEKKLQPYPHFFMRVARASAKNAGMDCNFMLWVFLHSINRFRDKFVPPQNCDTEKFRFLNFSVSQFRGFVSDYHEDNSSKKYSQHKIAVHLHIFYQHTVFHLSFLFFILSKLYLQFLYNVSKKFIFSRSFHFLVLIEKFIKMPRFIAINK